MKKNFSLALVLLFALMAGAQQTINDANAEKRSVSGFHAVDVSGGIDLYISGGAEAVAVSASAPRYRDKIRTEVKEGVLHIWYDGSYGLRVEFGDRKLKAYVSFSSLDAVKASGGSDIIATGDLRCPRLKLGLSGGSDFKGRVESDNLDIDASGGSDVNITGRAANLVIGASGGSDFHGYGLTAEQCALEASGGSDIHITVTRQLDASASGGSDVYYKGDASLRKSHSSGSSSIKKVAG